MEKKQAEKTLRMVRDHFSLSVELEKGKLTFVRVFYNILFTVPYSCEKNQSRSKINACVGRGKTRH